jgi:hypothetical protein
MRRIGVLMAYAEGDKEAQAWIAAFRERLEKLSPQFRSIAELEAVMAAQAREPNAGLCEMADCRCRMWP